MRDEYNVAFIMAQDCIIDLMEDWEDNGWPAQTDIPHVIIEALEELKKQP